MYIGGGEMRGVIHMVCSWDGLCVVMRAQAAVCRLGGMTRISLTGQVSMSHDSSRLELTMVDSTKSSSRSHADPVVGA